MIWQDELKNSIKKPDQLVELGVVNEKDLDNIKRINYEFPFSITPHYASLIDWHNPSDPLLLSVAPTLEEMDRTGYHDISGEAENTKETGIQSKYPATVLILPISACFSYCRYCFRKRLFNPKIKTEEIIKNFDSAFEYINSHKDLNNILITGGDPLIIKTPQLEKFLMKICELEHIKIIRIGTRVLSYLPSRITSDSSLIELFNKVTKQKKGLYIVNHFNHPREITNQTLQAIKLLTNSGVILANQSVMLKNINDNTETLNNLFNILAQIGITPYYHFQCKFIKSANHFRTTLMHTTRTFHTATNGLNGLAKRVKLIMTHFTGKIEILGVEELNSTTNIFLKYHQARNPELVNRIFTFPINDRQYWLDDIPEAEFLYQDNKL